MKSVDQRGPVKYRVTCKCGVLAIVECAPDDSVRAFSCRNCGRSGRVKVSPGARGDGSDVDAKRKKAIDLMRLAADPNTPREEAATAGIHFARLCQEFALLQADAAGTAAGGGSREFQYEGDPTDLLSILEVLMGVRRQR